MAKKKVEKWFEPGEPTNWRKADSQATRIRKLVKSRDGDVLASARAMQQLANISQDKETARKAKADATLLFSRYRKSKK